MPLIKKKCCYLLPLLLLCASCSRDHDGPSEPPTSPEALADSAKTLFFMGRFASTTSYPWTSLAAYTPKGVLRWRQEYDGQFMGLGFYGYQNAAYLPMKVSYPANTNDPWQYKLFSLDMNTGSERWSVAGNDYEPVDVWDRNDSVFYVQGLLDNTNLVILDNKTGKGLTTQPIKSELGFSRMTIDANGPYIYCIIHNYSGSLLMCYNFQSKSVVWKTAIGTSDLAFQQPPIVLKDKLLVTNGAGSLLAYDKRTGETKWTSSERYYSPVVGENVVYALAYKKGLVALNLETGKPLWTWSMDIGFNSKNLLSLMGNKIIVSSSSINNGPFVASINSASGELYWQQQLPDEFYSMVATGDVIYGMKLLLQGSRLMIIDAKQRKARDSVSFNWVQSLRVLTATGKFLRNGVGY